MIKHAEASKSGRFLPTSKKAWLTIGAFTLMFIVLAGFVLFSRYAWDKYENDYIAWHSNVESRIDRNLGLASKTLDDRNKKLSSLHLLNDDIKAGGKKCAAYTWLHWQQMIDVIEQKINKCKLLVNRVEQFGGDLQAVVDHLESEKATSLIIEETNLATSANEDNLAAVKDHWGGVVLALEKQKVSKTFTSTNRLAVEKVKLVRDAWQSIIDASLVKDRSKYETGINTLKVAYDGLAAIGVSSEKALMPLLDSAQKSYEQVFERR